jgi:hypothetical protein
MHCKQFDLHAACCNPFLLQGVSEYPCQAHHLSFCSYCECDVLWQEHLRPNTLHEGIRKVHGYRVKLT